MQRILVVQRDGLGDQKLQAARDLGLAIELLELHGPFEVLIDAPEACFPADLDARLARAELVIDHLYHPDLTEHLVARCRAAGRTVIAAGRKLPGADTPTTCCTLARAARFGAYGEAFGAPELEVAVVEGRIARLTVRRGAPCGATERAAADVIGLPVAEAVHRIGLVTQFHCFAKANPNVFFTNPLHVAGEVHIHALRKALAEAGLEAEDPEQVPQTAASGSRARGGQR